MDQREKVEEADGGRSAVTAREVAVPPEAARLRRSALDWLRTMHVEGGPVWEYRMNAGSDATVFNSCFAVYIRRVLGDLQRLSEEERREWLAYFQGFQDEETGLFVYPEAQGRATDEGHDEEHLNRQLTTFCVSAIDALGGEPQHRFAFLKPWEEPERLTAWMEGLGWHRPWNCGNKVMFLGILLAYSWDRWGDESARAALDVWFDWLDRHQSPKTGFWGRGREADYYAGMGGSYHEFVIYHYMGRATHYEDCVVDRVLLLQQPDGLYTPQQGGGTCDDIDAIDALVHFYHQGDYRQGDIRQSLRKSLRAILANQNPDGGFCWARPYRFGLQDYFRVATGILQHRHPFLWYWNARRGIRDQRPAAQNRPIRTGWNEKGRLRRESSLFDTWLRCTTIGEICTVLTDEPYAAIDWQYLSAPGVGWFRAPGIEGDRS